MEVEVEDTLPYKLGRGWVLNKDGIYKGEESYGGWSWGPNHDYVGQVARGSWRCWRRKTLMR